MGYLHLVAFSFCLLCAADGCTRFCDQSLYEHLFGENSSYRSEVQPAEFLHSKTYVRLQLNINNLLDINEVDEKMSINGFFYMEWKDARLAWDKAEYGNVSSLVVPATKVWLPDVILSNSGSSYYDYSYKRDFLVDIHYQGFVLWEFGGIMTTNCDINMQNYPFDTQNCSVDIETWRYDLTKMQLLPSLGAVSQAAQTDSLWKLTSYEVQTSVLTFGSQNYQKASFQLVWQRRRAYYYFNIIIPAFLMLVVALGVFWLPVESGEKISLAVTLLLAFSVFLIIIMDNTPANSLEIPLLTKFVMLSMCVTTLSLVTSIGMAHMSWKSEGVRVPGLLRTVCFKYLAKILCMVNMPSADEDSKVQEIEHNGIAAKSYNKNRKSLPEIAIKQVLEVTSTEVALETVKEKRVADSEELKQISSSIEQVLAHLDSNVKADQMKHEWSAVGRIIDRMIFWIVLVALVTLIPLIMLKRI